jgi:hypothetical protein
MEREESEKEMVMAEMVLVTVMVLLRRTISIRNRHFHKLID